MPEDADQLARLRWEFHYEDGVPSSADSETIDEFRTRFRAFFARALESNGWTIWVAEVFDEIVSHVYVYTVPKVPRPTQTTDAWGYVTNVYTVPDHRGQDVGSALMAAVRNWASDRRLELLLVWPSKASRTFYERAGFSPDSDVLECPVLATIPGIRPVTS